MLPSQRRIKGSDIQALREILGLNILDTFWLMGSLTHRWRTTGEAGETPLNQPSAGILVRYLANFPEDSPVPKMPRYDEIFDLVRDVFPKKLSSRRFGVIMGTSGWSGNRWMHGGEPSPLVQRLFLVLRKAIENDGEEGLLRFLEVVDTEARVRGIEGGLEELLRRGAWREED